MELKDTKIKELQAALEAAQREALEASVHAEGGAEKKAALQAKYAEIPWT